MKTYALLTAIGVCIWIVRRLSKKRRCLPLPPGPPADPLIGHLRVFPEPHNTAEVFHDWSLKYGDVVSLRVPGKTIVVLASEQAASGLLEKRSAIYSDRTRLGYYDQVGWGDAVIFAAYGPFHTRQRKMYNEALGKNAVAEYRPVQEREANILLKGLLDEPEIFDRHAARWSVASLPSWAPGAWFVNFIKETKPIMDAIVHANYEKVVEQMKEGTAQPSFVSKLLEGMYGQDKDPEQERALRLAAGMIFAAGFETTWHIITIFIAAMLLHPEAQQQAQEEIDRVIGRDRLPDLNDRESLPYVQCVINEVMRWQPVTPFGLPHRLMVDDEYKGMHIPKGSIVIANTRSMTWDETKFHDPQQFKPERFLPKPEGAGEIFPTNAVFGWGRRICAGRFLAEGSLWTAAVRILAIFSISPMKDAQGRVMKPEVKFRTTLTRHTEPFTCNILPRDEKARKMIEDCF